MNKAPSPCAPENEHVCSENVSSLIASCQFNEMTRVLRRAVARVRGGAMLAVALTMILPFVAHAQTSGVAARVTERIDNSQLVTLRGNTHALARAQFDQGAAPPDLPMNRIMLVLNRSADQETALQNLLTQQQVNSSPTFHKWLTPDQFGRQFGPADADIQAVTSWLASYGFQSIKVSRGRTVIEFSGTASQVAAGLHTSIHKYTVNGESHWANASDPQIPAALAPVIAGVASLHNFPKRASSNRSTQMASLTRDSNGKPQITFTDNSHGLAPGDFNTIYDIAPTMTGAGMTIGVIARTNISLQDIIDFKNTFGLPGGAPNIILNGPDPGDAGGGEEAEAVLDATWSGAVAPGATVDLVISEPTNAAAGEDLSEFYIIDNNLADVMTESFSVCEAAFLPNNLTGANGFATFYSGMAEQAAAQGITYTVASGDSGPDGCANPNIVQASGAGPSVNLLASTPFTVAVGGTQFNDIASPSTYWNANNSGNHSSAKSYIPENVWNESCTVAQCDASAGLWSSGGGASIAFTRPSWQAGVAGIPTGTARLVPDVSMAAAGHDGYVLCLDGSCQGTGCPPPGTGPCFSILSGTSASAQVFGGVMALVDQKVGGRVGVANFALYKLASPTFETLANCNASALLPAVPPAGTCIFNDVTFGDTNLNIVGENGFPAGVGYDEATGLGSVDVTNLITKWSTAITEGTSTTLSLATSPVTNPITLTHGQTVSADVTVTATTSGAGTPSGDVSLIAGGTALPGVGGNTLGTSGSVTWNTVDLPGGSYQVTAHYEGDGKFLGSDSAPVNVVVNQEGSQTNLGIVVNTPCTLASSVTYGSAYILSVAVQDLNSVSTPCAPPERGAFPTGAITLVDTLNGVPTPLYGGNNFNLNSRGYFEDQPIQLPAGTHSLKANYAGDSSFSGSSATIPLTVARALTTTSVSAAPMTVSAGNSVTLSANIQATQSNAFAIPSQEPGGTVQFLVNGAVFGGPATVNGVVSSALTFAQSTATLPTQALHTGQNIITAQYSGDSNYLSSITTSSVTVNVGTAGVNVQFGCASSTITIASPGQSGTCLVTVTGANNFSGNVTLTCGLSGGPAGAADLPSCSFGAPDSNFTAPGTITLTSNSQTGTATLMVGTTAASHLLAPPSQRQGPNWLLISEIGAALACLFLLAVASRERRGVVTFAAVLFITMAAITGCSGGNASGTGITGNPGTTTGAYTITVKVTPAGGTATLLPVTVNVQ